MDYYTMVLHIQFQVSALKETQHKLQSMIKKTKQKTNKKNNLFLHIRGGMMDRLEEDIFVLYQRLYHLPLVADVV